MKRFWARDTQVTMKEFAATEGVSFNALVYRVYQKEKLEREQAKRKKEAAGGVRVVPVTLRAGVPQSEAGAMATRDGVDMLPWMEAETAGGVRLRFGVGTDQDYVAGLLLRLAGGAVVRRGGGTRC
jgi:hypothetical protein